MGVVLRISTPAALKLMRLVQEFELCASAQGARREREIMVALKNRERILPRFFQDVAMLTPGQGVDLDA
jgi:hypothetical protein